uniref:Aminoacyl tRNA synthase complex-interacting multifunctional protein 1-like protein n=1 Tax=Acartia pacifica TaxID=335913 RepID=A0A0U2UEQ5_ACAPC|nr:aminoacyl tRNA synthase complex-interacting multifunctional protein 1-like protein [Acartia pacifica]
MKLETRAVAAEKLIQVLKSQIEAAKGQASSSANMPSAELKSLQSENASLKEDISLWIKKLNDAERKNGKTVFTSNDVVSPKMSENEVTAPTKCSESTTPAPKGDQDKKAEKKPKKEKAGGGAAGKPAEPEAPIDVGRLDLRVGHIRTAKKHPDADSLYVEEVDVGEEKPRTVISGLVKFIPEPEMQDRMAVLLCNLKPSKMRGIMSEAMVMCASTPDKVEILSAPEGSKPGDPVEVEGYTRNPDAQLNPKKKIFEACAPDLRVNSNKEACYKGVRWTVNGKPVTSQTLTDVNVK